MQAAQLMKYHKTNPQIAINDIARPQIGTEQLLIQVKAAGVNPLDNLIAHGDLKLVVPYKLPQTMGERICGDRQAGWSTRFPI